VARREPQAPFGLPAGRGVAAPYGMPAPYAMPAPYMTPVPYGMPAPYAMPAPYGMPAPYSMPAPVTATLGQDVGAMLALLGVQARPADLVQRPSCPALLECPTSGYACSRLYSTAVPAKPSHTPVASPTAMHSRPHGARRMLARPAERCGSTA